VSLILINDMNALASPSQAQGALHQVVLAHGAGGVVAHLHQRGLAYVDQGIAVQMVRLDLAQRWMREHHGSPFVRVVRAPLRRAPGEQPVALRVE